MSDDDERLFVWQVFEHDKWSILGAMLPGSTEVVPLVSSSRRAIDLFGLVAVAHHDATGLPVRKVMFVLEHVLREVR